MKLKINSDGFKFTFYMPLFLLKSRWLIKMIKKKSNSDFDIDQFKQVLPKIISELRKFKRANKNFILLDVLSSDNDHVTIKL